MTKPTPFQNTSRDRGLGGNGNGAYAAVVLVDELQAAASGELEPVADGRLDHLTRPNPVNRAVRAGHGNAGDRGQGTWGSLSLENLIFLSTSLYRTVIIVLFEDIALLFACDGACE